MQHPIGLQELARLERAEALRRAQSAASQRLGAELGVAVSRPGHRWRLGDWLDWRAWRRRVFSPRPSGA